MNKTVTIEQFTKDFKSMTNKAMAKKYNVSYWTIGFKAKKIGLGPKSNTHVGRKLTLV